MAHTIGHDFSGYDGLRNTLRMERQARPAGRFVREIDADMAEIFDDEFLAAFDAAEEAAFVVRIDADLA